MVQADLFAAKTELDSKIETALGSKTISEMEKAVLVVLAQRRGAAEAYRIDQIIAWVRNYLSLLLTERQVKDCVKHLVEDFGIPIVGSRVMPYGYYLPTTKDEFDAAVRPLESEIRSLARRIAAIKGSVYLRQLVGQLDLPEVR